MAQSRLEKVGTIYSRVTSLLKSGAMKEENKPLWYEIYEAFPPKYEPSYDRKASVTKVRQIFYAEDKIRAKFHKDFKEFSSVNLLDNNSVSKTEQFIGICKYLKKQGISEDEVYTKAVEAFKINVKSEVTERQKRALTKRESVSKQPIQSLKKNIELQDFLQEIDEEFEDLEDKEQYVSRKKLVKDSKDVESNLAKDLEDEVQYKPIRLNLKKYLEDSKDVKSNLEKHLEEEAQYKPIRLDVEKILKDNEDDPNKAKK